MALSSSSIEDGSTTRAFLLKSLMAGDGRPRFMWKISPGYSTRGERPTFKTGANARSDYGALTASSIGFLSVAHHCTMKRVQWCGGSELAFILKTASKKNCFAWRRSEHWR